MVEIGKRSRHHRGDGDHKNQRRRTDRDEKDREEVVIYRILCPDNVIGSVIGKSGKVINSIRQESRARVKVVDPFPGARDRVITIYCYIKEKGEIEIDDEFDDRVPLCAAQDALIKVHSAISNAVATLGDSDKRRKDKEECQILVPSSQTANIIGKSGTTIKKLRNKTDTNIKIISKDVSDPTHSCALDFDNFVLISGDSDAVKRALFAISAIMYKFTPKEEIPLDTTIPEAPPSFIISSDIPIYPAPALYPNVDHMGPTRSVHSLLRTHVPELSGYSDLGGGTYPIYSSALPIISGYNSEELIMRVLCPSKKIGRVIGKGGMSIKNVRQASGARIEVDDARADREECTITVISKESPEDIKSMGVEAVLLLQEKINDEEEESGTIRLIVPSKVIGCIIGKSGSIINEIRKRTRADIRISKGQKARIVDSGDELVEVFGEVNSVRDALVQIVLRLRDEVLKDHEGGGGGGRTPIGGGGGGGGDLLHHSGGGAVRSMSHMMPSVPSVTPSSYEPRGESGLLSSSLYGYGSLSMGDTAYGSSLSSYQSKLYSGLPPPSTLEMVVPAHAVGRVIGKGGANIENIRKISGADIEISESRSSRGDRVAIISGTSEQKRGAENLIQAFIMAT